MSLWSRLHYLAEQCLRMLGRASGKRRAAPMPVESHSSKPDRRISGWRRGFTCWNPPTWPLLSSALRWRPAGTPGGNRCKLVAQPHKKRNLEYLPSAFLVQPTSRRVLLPRTRPSVVEPVLNFQFAWVRGVSAAVVRPLFRYRHPCCITRLSLVVLLP